MAAKSAIHSSKPIVMNDPFSAYPSRSAETYNIMCNHSLSFLSDAVAVVVAITTLLMLMWLTELMRYG